MWVADQWQDYMLLDAGEGEKLERWGAYTVRRPDPQAIWPRTLGVSEWERVDAWYHRSASGGGQWEYRTRMPDTWQVGYRDLRFLVKLTGFKHTGLFPEQAVNWDWLRDKIVAAGDGVQVLNLFAYTGGATVACAAAGADVVHLDASKGMTQMARDNIQASGLGERRVRYIVDDAVKFVEREIRRGNVYDGIILDPPSFGRGKSGEVWDLERDLMPYLQRIKLLVRPKPLFLVINAYASGISRYSIENIIRVLWAEQPVTVVSEEIGLPVQSRQGVYLPAGCTIRVSSEG
jgi:23S rRNA (cytosine1962-C5)-methyltransferase